MVKTLEMDGIPSSEDQISKDLFQGVQPPIFWWTNFCQTLWVFYSGKLAYNLKKNLIEKSYHLPSISMFLLLPAIYFSSYMYIFQYYIRLLKPASPTLVALFLHQRRMPKILDSNQREEAEINKKHEKTQQSFQHEPHDIIIIYVYLLDVYHIKKF